MGKDFFFEKYAYSILSKKQVDEMKKMLEKEKKDKEPKQPTEVPDMNLDDDDNKN